MRVKIEKFWEFVKQMRIQKKYSDELFVNADQTSLFIEMPHERTLDHKGARTVHDAVPEELMRKSFRTCGIANDLSGSEDRLVLSHLRTKAEVEIMDDMHGEEGEDEYVNPLYNDCFVEPPVDAPDFDEDDNAADAQLEELACEGEGPLDDPVWEWPA
ncbi:hypothetical protein CLOM_g18236 [Closterium sp. NIES-68]|nr:hypothetical protein CLOM_g18236 [Closterium sp. NIES-68]GJP63384.1 hypothetical protein CLOP_g20473 [Closterium sp. NIES-67]